MPQQQRQRQLQQQLQEALNELNAIKREAAAQKERQEVTESFTAVLKDVKLPEDLRKEILECACQMQADSRDQFKSVLSKMGPLFVTVDDASLDGEGDAGSASEESEKPEKVEKPAPRIGGGKKSGYSLLESIGLKR